MSGNADGTTLSTAPRPRSPAGPRQSPQLFLVLESHIPTASPLRFTLDGIDEVTIGRGRARRWEHHKQPTPQMALSLDDPWLSSKHARLSRINRRWVFQDVGSKNGSFVNGTQQQTVELEDGDVIELGHTFFLFRTTIESTPDAQLCFDAASVTAPAPGLSTMIPALARAFDQLTSVARSDIPVLLEGAPGTGKEVLARAVHAASGRSGPFITVNCSALPRELIEAELFGHRKGIFTGATEDRPGLVRAAHKGTLFLDEIGDLPLEAQAKLLRVLQEREVRPVGDTRTIKVDLRLVAATNRPLERMVEAGTFRLDLFGRLAGHRVELPPLRERREDIGLLVGNLLQRHAAPNVAAKMSMDPQAARTMLQYAWPGNVRELELAIQSALVLAADTAVIKTDALPKAVQQSLSDAATTRRNEEAAQRAEIVEQLKQHKGNVTAVAQAMGKHRQQVQRWLKQYGIDPEAYRP